MIDLIPLAIGAIAWCAGSVYVALKLSQEVGVPSDRAGWVIRVSMSMAWPIVFVGGCVYEAVRWTFATKAEGKERT